ncbi:LamB/YcsF family protein [Bacillus sp. SL00103]
MYQVDINCDLGESFGQYTIGSDQQIFKNMLPQPTSPAVFCRRSTVIKNRQNGTR